MDYRLMDHAPRGPFFYGKISLSQRILLFNFLNAKIAADFSCQKIIGFIMARHGGRAPRQRIKKDAVFSAFPNKYAAIF